MPYTLELCAGTQSFSHVARARGYTPVTLDSDPAFGCTHTCDVRTFDVTQYPQGHFTYIWCSPPCTHFSNAKRFGDRDYVTADAIVRTCLDVIAYYQPRAWFIENPASGYLKSRPYIAHLPFHKLDYCAYDDALGRRKRTAVWTDVATFAPRLCKGPGLCPSMVGKCHRATCTGSYWDATWKTKRDRAIACARVPPTLVEALLDAAVQRDL
jgi:hypothetical protein